MHTNISNKWEQRKFGLMMAGAIAVVGLFRWWHRGALPTGFFTVAAVFLFLGILLPGPLRPILAAWLKFAEILNWVVTHVLLTLAFFLLIWPTRLILGLVGHDPLKREWEPDASTYWEDPEEQGSELDQYRNQF